MFIAAHNNDVVLQGLSSPCKTQRIPNKYPFMSLHTYTSIMLLFFLVNVLTSQSFNVRCIHFAERPFFRSHCHSFLMPITIAERTPVFIRKLASAITITGRRSPTDNCLYAEKSAFSRLIAIKTSATASKIHLFFIAVSECRCQ